MIQKLTKDHTISFSNIYNVYYYIDSYPYKSYLRSFVADTLKFLFLFITMIIIIIIISSLHWIQFNLYGF
eukprot:UN02456